MELRAWMSRTLLAAVVVVPVESLAEPEAFRVGLLMDVSGGSADVVRDRQRAFDLAIKHVNAGGGVHGRPVEVVVGDTEGDPAGGGGGAALSLKF